MIETNDLTEPLQNRNQKKRSRVNSFMEVSKPPIKFYSLKSVRLRICLLSMMGLFVSTSMRVSLNMAVVCMVNSTAFQVEITNKSFLSMADQNCPRISFEEEQQKGYHGTFLWDSDQQSWLLSATFYGGLATVWIAGLLADKFGPKLTLFLGAADAMIVTLLTPLLAKSSFHAFLIARIIMGVGEGFIFPSITSLIARWIPKGERSTSAAMTTSGNQFASIFGLWFSSLLCGSDFLGGWPLIFYFFGTISFFWCVIWLYLISNSPTDNKHISKEEAIYLKEQLESQSIVHKSGTNKLYSNPVPWLKIFTSVPIIVNFFAQFVYNFSITLLQTYLPTYMKQVLRVELTKNGFFAMMPFLTQLVTKNIVAVLSDYLKRKGYVSNTNGCKIFQCISNIGSAACFVILAFFVDCHSLFLAVITLLFYGAFFSAGVCGFFTSQLSVAPQYTGLLFSISRLASIFGGVIVIKLVGYINEHGTIEEWKTIWLISAVLNTVIGIVYAFFSSAEIQPWAKQIQPVPSSEKMIELELKVEEQKC